MKEYLPQEDEDVYFDELEDEKPGASRLFISLFIGIFAIGGLCLLGWVFFQNKTLSVEDTPIIKADNNPNKVKPDDPGGMVVANMDKTVYDTISGNMESFDKNEKVLPAPEEPIDRIQVIQGQPQPKEAETDVSDIAADSDEVQQDVDVEPDPTPASAPVPTPKESRPAVLSEAVKASSGDAVRPITESDLKLVPHVPEKPKEAVVGAVQTISSPVRGYKVQLAAFRTEKDAVETWQKFQRSHRDLLGNLRYYIERKDVAGKGTFYRLQAGMVVKEADARLLCKKLSEVSQGCFVVE